jgi:3-hydroxyisobutyrate dehydrogenase-like beta-hydroxyacid dehydrogenase
MAGQCELGVTGLATMGANLARNAARKGFPVAVHNRTESRTRELLDRHGDEGELVGTFSTAEFVAALARPRRILVAAVCVGPALSDLVLVGRKQAGNAARPRSTRSAVGWSAATATVSAVGHRTAH